MQMARKSMKEIFSRILSPASKAKLCQPVLFE